MPSPPPPLPHPDPFSTPSYLALSGLGCIGTWIYFAQAYAHGGPVPERSLAIGLGVRAVGPMCIEEGAVACLCFCELSTPLRLITGVTSDRRPRASLRTH